ncbi:MAG: zinc-ribbon domain-containing protein [Erysipelotrichaceae bacterium]|jgi:ribosomal protein L37E|nr:zinc-ribbon domain-containing protein [Erysipelotrichaceae bacterium]
MKCKKCGAEVALNDRYCSFCGYKIEEPEAPRKDYRDSYHENARYDYEKRPYYPPQSTSPSSAEVLILIFGILSPFLGVIGFVLGIISLVFANKELNNGNNSKLITAGRIFAIIGIVLFSIFLALLLVLIVFDITLVHYYY